MNIAKQFIWLLITLFILTALGWYYGHSIDITRLDNETLANSIETTVSQLKVRQFDKAGLLANRLTTPIMQHIPKDNVYLFQRPHILISQAQQPPWDIRSNSAQSFEGGQLITFKGNVIVHQKQEGKTQESTLRTEEVTYFPNEKKQARISL